MLDKSKCPVESNLDIKMCVSIGLDNNAKYNSSLQE